MANLDEIEDIHGEPRDRDLEQTNDVLLRKNVVHKNTVKPNHGFKRCHFLALRVFTAYQLDVDSPRA